MSYGRRCGLRPVSPYVIVLALAVVLTASFFLPTRAEAAVSDHTVPFPNHTVPTISPSGTTINLFDYWVNPDNHLSVSGNGGINASHRFQFNDGQGDAPLNHWTGNTNPQPGIVSNTLSDGYPQLSGTYGGDSLRYLFDSSAQTGKTSHFGVTGLLKAQDGYYVYDSSENYAAYNADKNAFDVYDTWGIDKVAIRPIGVSSSRSMRQTRCSRRKAAGSSKMASRQTTPVTTSTTTSASQCPRDSCSPTAA